LRINEQASRVTPQSLAQIVHSSSSGVAAEALASVGLEQSAAGGGKQILLDDPTANPVQRFGPG
jgi:hypothetical protein